MQIAFDIGIVILAYIFGSIPFGLLIVKLKTGKDIREVESGRTGGTNAMRAAGFWAGFATALLDILKGAVGVWVAQWLTPNSEWVHVLAPIAAILGHNYSIFLAERGENGKFRLRGGAGAWPARRIHPADHLSLHHADAGRRRGAHGQTQRQRHSCRRRGR